MVAVDIFRDISVLLPNDDAHTAGSILRTTVRGVGEHLAGVVRSGTGHMTGSLLYGNVEVVSRFLDAVEGRGESAEISGAAGLAVVRTIDALIRGVRAGA